MHALYFAEWRHFGRHSTSRNSSQNSYANLFVTRLSVRVGIKFVHPNNDPVIIRSDRHRFAGNIHHIAFETPQWVNIPEPDRDK